MAHSKIDSIAEPHFLLPLIHSIKKEGTLTYYSHLSSYQATTEMIQNLPNGLQDYYDMIRKFSCGIYSRLTHSNSEYFVDKTPRYFWIIPELKAIFPEAKFIFLYRNPIQIYASVINTFGKDGFGRIYEFDSSLKMGFTKLSEGFEMLKDSAIAVQYEELIENPESTLNRIMEYLDLKFEDSMLKDFVQQDLRGSFIDPTGVQQYSSLDKEPLNKWKKVLTSRLRKRLALKFLSKISSESLLVQGYSKSQIRQEIVQNEVKGNHNVILDAFHYYKSKIIRKLDLNLFLAPNMEWTKEEYLC